MLWSTLLLAFSAATGALAQNNATEPKAPQLTFLYSANATVGPLIDYGKGPWGQRVALPITGGTFSGPKLAGSIINLGADWGLIDSFGVFTPDTRYGLQTQDGANIYVRTSGPASTRPYEVHLRLVFETGHANYTWLNHIVAVGVLTGYPTYVLIDVWQMETL